MLLGGVRVRGSSAPETMSCRLSPEARTSLLMVFEDLGQLHDADHEASAA